MCREVLVIEDDEGIRESLKDVLEIEGYAVSTATNGLEGLRALEEAKELCLILLDLMMPVMNGWQFLEAIRERGGELPPIAVVSAAVDAGDVMRYGCRLLAKPVDLDRLMNTVRESCA